MIWKAFSENGLKVIELNYSYRLRLLLGITYQILLLNICISLGDRLTHVLYALNINFYKAISISIHWYNLCACKNTGRANSVSSVPYVPKQNRRTEGCSKLKSPDTRQIQEWMVSTLEQKQVPTRTWAGVRSSKRPLLACRTNCNCSMETSHN